MKRWVVDFLNAAVASEMTAQPRDIQAKFLRISQLIEVKGLTEVHEPHIKHLQDRLWEMRMSGKDGIARAIYVTAIERRVVVLRVFTKKTEKTPRAEIEVALKRSREVT